MLDQLAQQSDQFHLLFGIAAILVGLLFLNVLRRFKAGSLPQPLPPHLRFLMGEGMPQLLGIAGWLALLGGAVITLSALALLLA